MYQINKLPEIVRIGYQAEGKVKKFRIDVTEWLEQWPEGIFMATAMVPGVEGAIPLVTGLEEGVLTVSVTKALTRHPGKGSINIRLLSPEDEEFEKRSALMAVEVEKSHPPEVGEAPEPVREWLTHAVRKQEEFGRFAEEAREEFETAQTERAQAYQDAETGRNSNYQNAETQRGNDYQAAETERNNQSAQAIDNANAAAASANTAAANYSYLDNKVHGLEVEPVSRLCVSSNLLDTRNIIPNKSFSPTSGELTDNASNSATQFIPVLPGETYTSKWVGRSCFYDANKVFISTTTQATFVTPNNAHYARFAVTKAFVDVSAQLNLGSDLLPFEPFYQAVEIQDPSRSIIDSSIRAEKTRFMEIGTNLLSRENALEQHVISAGASEPTPNTGYNVSDFFPIKPGTTYSSKYVLRVTFYDREFRYINYRSMTTDPDTGYATWTVQDDARIYFARASFHRVYYNNQINEGDVLLDFEHGGHRLLQKHLPIRAIGARHLEDFELTNFNNGEQISFDFAQNTFRSYGVYPVMDIPINGVFGANKVYTDAVKANIYAYKSADIYALYDALVTAYPTYITKTLLCNEDSPDALPIYRYDFKPVRPQSTHGTKAMKILLTSGVHPERMGVWNVYHLLENICNNWQDDSLLEALRFNIHFIVVPVNAPWSYDNNSRVNYNGVDMARNFPARWTQGEPGYTWGGTEPLTEPEAIAVYEIMQSTPDLYAVIDSHNFFPTAGTDYRFLWCACENSFSSNISNQFLQRIDRKWKKDLPAIVDQDPDTFIGYTVGTAPGGSLGAQGHAFGIKGALTFETGCRFPADAAGDMHDGRTATLGYEAIVNFMLMLIDELVRRN